MLKSFLFLIYTSTILCLPTLPLFSLETNITLTKKERQFIFEHPQIKLGGSLSFEPFLIQNIDGSIGGFDAEITEIITNKTGLNINFELGNWKDIQNRSRNREFDGLSTTSKTYNTEREKYYNQSSSYVTIQPVVIVKKGNSDKFTKIEDLIDHRASVQIGNEFFINIIKGIDKDVDIQYVKDIYDMIRMVVNNEVDYTILDETAFYVASMIGMGGLIEVAFPIDEPYDLCFSLNNEWPELVSIFNKVLDSLSENDKYRIRKKWFTFSDVTKLNDDMELTFTGEELSYLSQKSVIRMGMESNAPPFELIITDQEPKGIVYDYMKLLSDKIGIVFELYPTNSLSEELSAVQNGDADLITITENPSDVIEGFNYTEPYLSFPYVVVTTNEKLFINDINTLIDETFLVIKDSSIGQTLINRNFNISEVDNIEDGFKALRDGIAYGYIDSSAVVSYHLQDEYKLDIKISALIKNEQMELKIATAKNNKILYSIIQKALRSITEEEKNQIVNRWIAIVLSERVDYSTITKVGLSLIFLLFITLFWNRKLSISEHKTHKAMESLSLLQIELKRMALIDPLTLIYNRNKLNKVLEVELLKAKRHNHTMGIILIDIDLFKRVNDTYGHNIGDTTLKEFAGILKNRIREIDILGRWGGEEFLIICSSITEAGLLTLSENLRTKIESTFITDVRKITASIGITTYKDGDNHLDIISRADKALYKAKKNGRNRVEVC
ncbi:MAG: transporter substrate-binding domain-containing protein [Spirochaetaceae bacterium]